MRQVEEQDKKRRQSSWENRLIQERWQHKSQQDIDSKENFHLDNMVATNIRDKAFTGLPLGGQNSPAHDEKFRMMNRYHQMLDEQLAVRK